MKNLLHRFVSGHWLLYILLFILSQESTSQVFQRVYGNEFNNYFIKVIKHGANYYVLGLNNKSNGMLPDATVSYMDATGHLIWTLSTNIPSAWNDAVLTPTGDLLVVGSTIPLDASAKSLIGSVGPTGGSFNWLNVYDAPEKDVFNRIIESTNPQLSAFPYYVLGSQNQPGGMSFTEDVILYNFDEDGGINWKKIYDGPASDDYYKDLEVYPNGDLLLAGHTTTGLIFKTDNTGTPFGGVDINNLVFNDLAHESSGGLYAVANVITGPQSSQLLKFDADLLLTWHVRIPQLLVITQVFETQPGEIIVVGGGFGRTLIIKILDNGSPSVDWVKYYDIGANVTSGSAWLMPNSQIGYVDTRSVPGGFGLGCGFFSLSDLDLSICNISEVDVDLIDVNSLPNSPQLPAISFLDVFPPMEIPDENVEWDELDLCSSDSCFADFDFEIDCGVVSFFDFSTIPFTPSWSWTFEDGSPATSTSQNPVVTFPGCGVYEVCLTINGSNGLSGCSQTLCKDVFINDNVPPVISCAGASFELDANCQASITPSSIGTAFDNCLIQSTSISPSIITNCGFTPVTFTATDWCGNTSTCMTEVYALEGEPPIITCRPNVVVTANGPAPCAAVVIGLSYLTATDNCELVDVSYFITGVTTGAGQDASGTTFNQGVSTITYTAIDACGNSSTCSFTVTVNCDYCACSVNNIPAINLINNGDFSLGDSGFSTDLNPNINCIIGTYIVDKNLNLKCNGWPSKTDHTTGTGNFFIIDGQPNLDPTIWSQQVNVIPGITYCFTYWTLSVFTATDQEFDLEARIHGNNGSSSTSFLLGTERIRELFVPGSPTWINHTVTWTCPLGFFGPYTLELDQFQTVFSQNWADFGLDDICFTNITPPDTCECASLEWAEVYGITPIAQPTSCDSTVLVIPCEKLGPEFVLHGDFPCLSDSCASGEVAWVLDKPGSLQDVSGLSVNPYSNAHFDISIPWGDFTQPGSYTITITRLCGTKLCSCKFNFVVEPCPCDCNDLVDDVLDGFTVTGNFNVCNRKIKPVSLCSNDLVSWSVNGPGLNQSYEPISGDSSLMLQFPYPGGLYRVCTFVDRIDPHSGDTCSAEYCRNLVLGCQLIPADTLPAITSCPGGNRLHNGNFTEGLVWGHLGDGGHIPEWQLFENPGDGLVFVNQTGAADDGHVVLVGREDNFAGIFQQVNIAGDSIWIGFNVINYLGVETPLNTVIEFRLQSTLAPESTSQVLYRHNVDSSSSAWIDVSLVIPSEIDMKFQYLVIGVQNKDVERNSVVGIDNVELCTDQFVGISSPTLFTDFLLYPNPNNGKFIVEFPQSVMAGSAIRIVDLTGHVVFERRIENNNSLQIIEAHFLPPGMYFLQVVSDHRVYGLNKFVKQ